MNDFCVNNVVNVFAFLLPSRKEKKAEEIFVVNKWILKMKI